MIVPTTLDKEIDIPLGRITLKARYFLPEDASGIVLFSHGSGSSRKSPRNNYAAEVLQEHHQGTLLFDLLTEETADWFTRHFEKAHNHVS